VSLFSDYSRQELETICPVEFTLQDLRVLQLALAGDTFAPGSQWDKAFQAAMTKIDTSLDGLRVQVLQDTAS
jgi:hypothetical protein